MSGEYYRNALIRLDVSYSSSIETIREAIRCNLGPMSGPELARLMEIRSDIRAILANAPKEAAAADDGPLDWDDIDLDPPATKNEAAKAKEGTP